MIIYILCYLTGYDSPQLKHLFRYVVPAVSSMWYKLGLELFDDEDVPLLDNIKANHPYSSETCCMEMFNLWCNKKLEGSWMQILDALKHIHHNKLAKQLLVQLRYTCK